MFRVPAVENLLWDEWSPPTSDLMTMKDEGVDQRTLRSAYTPGDNYDYLQR